jgi:predicted NUDIX family NTP pyrophosphohydrolase
VRASAGLLCHRARNGVIEVLLVHPGGPFWARRELGAWSIPKGEIEPGEEPLAAARREFTEELGVAVPDGRSLPLGEVRLRSGKRVLAWAVAGDVDHTTIVSNTVTVTVRGRPLSVPEVDRAEWFSLAEARVRLNPGQVPLLDRLERALEGSDPRIGYD